MAQGCQFPCAMRHCKGWPRDPGTQRAIKLKLATCAVQPDQQTMEMGMTRQNTAQKSGGCLQPEQNWHLRATELPRFNKHPAPLVPVFRARVQVSLRPSVLDPAGEATRAAAARLGVEGVRRLRIGKAIELELEAPDQGTAQSQLELLGDRLFANPVIENWRLELLDLVEEQQ